MAERGLRLLDASGLLITMARGSELEVVAEAGDAEPRVRSLPVAGTALGRLLETGASVRLERPSAREAPWLGELGLRPAAALVGPLPFDVHPGLIIALRSEARAFGRGDTVAANDLARHLAERLLAERSRERERLRHGVQARELERTRWARELHDETVQGLGALRLLLAAARDQDDDQHLRQAVNTALEQVDREVEGLRHLITALRPAALDDLGLVAALEALARRAGAIDGLLVQTEMAVGANVPRLQSEVESAIYRIVQEALTNAAKHSGAGRVRLALDTERDRVTATVSDDGDGFSVEHSPPADRDRHVGADHGVGLEGMRERAELVGAELEIRSEQGGGTTVRVSVPVGEVQP
jgi:signal transduction histidine kinase